MKTRYASISLFTVATMMCTLLFDASAQKKPVGGTVVENYASATYKDRKGKSYGTVSNAVTFMVAKVAGLTITPDEQVSSSLVPGQKAVVFRFRVTNTGNFTDQVRFLANGASIRIVGPATIDAAVIELPDQSSNIDIHKNGLDVLHSLAQDGSVDVKVNLNVAANATVGSTIQVFLGDAASGTNFDNVAADKSAHEVRTVSEGAENGSREARGDISAAIVSNGQIRVNLTVPPGPVVLGSNITYTVNACNDGGRDLARIDMIVPIPAGTQLAAANSLPANTGFTTELLNVLPKELNDRNLWTTTAPGDLSTVTRVAFRAAPAFTLSSGTCSAEISFNLTVTASDASTPIYGIADAFAVDPAGNIITDQSGDLVANKGDGNADFDEPISGAVSSTTQGFQQPTLLTYPAGTEVLIGPNGAPNATGPTDSNDDYTNLSLNTQTIPPDGTTTAPETFTFTNTIVNNRNTNDTFTLTAPTAPTGATVEISTDGGTNYTTVSGGNVNLAVAAGASSNINVRVTLPTGLNILTGYDTVIRAALQSDTTKTNETINRAYTGFIKLNKNVNTRSADPNIVGSGPGAEVTYTIAYENISSAGGNGSVKLTATDLVITEDGNAAPNNWGTTTDHVVGSAADTSNGTITGDAADSNLLTVTISSLPPGASGTFTFKRRIKK